MIKIIISKLTIALLLITFLPGCGFIGRYLNADEWGFATAADTYKRQRKLEAEVAPYMGTKCKVDIKNIFGYPDNIHLYPDKKAIHNADEIWDYRIKGLGWRTFYFREEILLAVRTD